MEAIYAFIEKLVVVKVTYIHNKIQNVPYAFGYQINAPEFRLTSRQHFRNSSVPRVYLSNKCLKTCIKQIKIGPLFTPETWSCDLPKLYDVLIIQIKHSKKGYFALHHLPTSWSQPLVCFFKYCYNTMKVKFLLETKANTMILFNELIIKFLNTNITTLFHMLVCLVTKNYDIIIDMLRFPRMRETTFESFETIKQSQDCKRHGVYIPTTTEFIMELSLFAQDSIIIQKFKQDLSKAIQLNPTNFKKEAREWIKKANKYEIYVKRILKQYNTLF